ncbi:glutathione hydrolase 1 proenzyme-like [Athalia rosae]|uniref:glutathione hydrolase 1 proenzyme-like n=1 Tax=Athalia rosae TaxID=37344 RepID=UPI0020337A80|nr:glutathione hydrolase 1 proenzyme-like [Athalia rosae]
MNYSDRQGLTEDAPLQGRIKGFSFKCHEDGGLKMTVISFTVLSIAITIALGLQLIYQDNILVERGHGAVATDYKDCSEIGTNILRKGGNAVDAAIAATVCMTVVSPHKTGLGGGGYAMIYSHKDRTQPLIIDFAKSTVQGAFGAVNVRLPALLRGLARAHALRGSLPWEQLISPSAKLAQAGFIVTKEFAQEVDANPNFISLYGQLEQGQNLTLPKLSETLNTVAYHGADEMYNGNLSRKFVDGSLEIQKQLARYEPAIEHANVTNFFGHLVYHRSDASALGNVLEVLNVLPISRENSSTLDSQLLFAETLIKSNRHSKAELTDTEERFSSVVVMDGLDSYVVIITGLSAVFGLGRLTNAGFLMDTAESNLEKLTPVVFSEAASVCGLRGIIGTDDVTLAAELFYNLIIRRLNVTAAIENPRYYLMSDGISIENKFPHVMDHTLRAHLSSMLNLSAQDADQFMKSCNAIIKMKDTMTGHSDSRGGGVASRFR